MASSLSELFAVARAPRARYGPAPVFEAADVVRAFYEIGVHAPLGRADLNARLGIGEGSVRTILSRLNDKHWLSTTRSGASLSADARPLFERLTLAFPFVSRVAPLEACFSAPSSALLARGKADAVGSGLSLRDSAIRAGADGLTALVRVKGVWRFPNDSARLRKNDDAVLDAALDAMHCAADEGDALVFGIAPSPPAAWRGAWTAAMTLLG